MGTDREITFFKDFVFSQRRKFIQEIKIRKYFCFRIFLYHYIKLKIWLGIDFIKGLASIILMNTAV